MSAHDGKSDEDRKTVFFDHFYQWMLLLYKCYGDTKKREWGERKSEGGVKMTTGRCRPVFSSDKHEK